MNEILKAVGILLGTVCISLLIAPWVAYIFGRYFKWCDKKMNEWK